MLLTIQRKTYLFIAAIKDYSIDGRDRVDNKPSTKDVGNILGIVSLVIAVVMLLFILNWIFKITPYQGFGGLSLLITPFVGAAGVILGIISIKIKYNKFGKLGIIINITLCILPYLYWFLGTLIFGP